jgi:adenylate cyclase
VGPPAVSAADDWIHVRDRIATRELDVIRVKGKEKPTRIFEVLGFPPLPPASAEMVRQFAAGLQAYRAQHWTAAMRCFQQALHAVPDDPPSQLYLRRCAAYAAVPPPADWDGVYSMTTK